MSSLPPEEHHTSALAFAPIDHDHLHRALSALDRVVRKRIEHEEGKLGLFAFICRVAPRYLSLVDRLRTDHRDFLRRIATVGRRVSHGDDLASLERDHAELISDIAAHEELEREVLRDALDPCV
jgi:hypothetical protein